MIQIEMSVIIHRPVDEVFAFVTDGSKAPGWQGGLEAVEGSTDRLGSQYTEVRKFMGQDMRSEMQVTVFDLNARWATRVLDGPVLYEVTVLLEPHDGSTRLTTRVEGEPTGLFRMAEGMVQSQMEKSIEEDLERLKQILEEM